MNLAQLTDFVWRQTDTTEFDLPAALIESYIDEAFQRTISAENQWPFYEKSWTVTVAAGEVSGALDEDVNVPAIMSVTTNFGDNVNYKLTQIDETEAELRFGTSVLGTGGYPRWYSVWDRNLTTWPLAIFEGDAEYIVRGYRKPLQTFDAVTGEVDADPRMHKPLAWTTHLPRRRHFSLHTELSHAVLTLA